MRWSWSVVVGLWVLVGCGPGNIPESAEENRKVQPTPEPPPRISVDPGAVVFPQSFVGQRTSASVRIRNEGEALALVELSIPKPFTLETWSLNLPPGAEDIVELSLEPERPGLTGAVLLLQAGPRRIELTVRAEVEPAPPR